MRQDAPERDLNAPLKRALRKGAHIEMCDGHGWTDDPSPEWLPWVHYRVKPEPEPRRHGWPVLTRH